MESTILIATFLWADGYWGYSRSGLTAGDYKVIVTDSNNCTADSTFSITQPDSLKLRLTINQPFCPEKPDGQIEATVSGGSPGDDYIFKWSDGSSGNIITNLADGVYTVTVSDINGCSVKDSVDLKPKNETCLVIPNAFSPNNDLINDVWNIGHIEEYPMAEITIYNNWGDVVWRSAKGYPTPWDGKSNGKALPIDSYYYTINLHNGTKPIAGSVTIIK